MKSLGVTTRRRSALRIVLSVRLSARAPERNYASRNSSMRVRAREGTGAGLRIRFPGYIIYRVFIRDNCHIVR